MDETSKSTIAANISLLMKINKVSQKELERRSGVSQATISNLINPASNTKYSPTAAILEKIAKAFNIKLWQLLIPNIPPELLASRTIEKVLENFVAADNQGRDAISRIAEAELRYIQFRSQPGEKEGSKK
jgi:Helix-turn-helix.